jgi:hypothetical protein
MVFCLLFDSLADSVKPQERKCESGLRTVAFPSDVESQLKLKQLTFQLRGTLSRIFVSVRIACRPTRTQTRSE